jgi:NAD(P)-dependent dehydrogenase (short-subunit alcohol dehydrogenase family)
MSQDSQQHHPPILIGTGRLTPDALSGQVAVVTGAGRGIGFEAARALIWLGAKVVLAEVLKPEGKAAEQKLAAEFGPGKALFVHTDVGDEGSVRNLSRQAFKHFEKVDIVLNNAVATPMGAVKDVPIDGWDLSYRVNLRGPVLLARQFLPGMLARNSGVFVAVASAGGAYMGAYEVLKTAQVDLARTLDAELEGSGVIAFTIGPGMVRTPGLEAALPTIAPLYGKTIAEFYEMSKEHIIPVEAAGAGFAAAVALANSFRGMEIGSRQALIAAGIEFEPGQSPATGLDPDQIERALSLTRVVYQTLEEQSQGWEQRPLFERQWVQRDFKRYAGMPAKDWLALLEQLQQRLEAGGPDPLEGLHVTVRQLVVYYRHTQEVLAGWEKDPVKREAHLKILAGYTEDAAQLAELVDTTVS